MFRGYFAHFPYPRAFKSGFKPHPRAPPKTREIVEFDILLDTDFDWGTSGAAGVMDLQNILTHELGHGARAHED